MTLYITFGGIIVAALGSLLFSSLTYALRDFSRARLSDHLQRRGKSDWLEKTVQHAPDLAFDTAVLRLLLNILVLIGVLRLLHETGYRLVIQYSLAVLVAGVITLFVSVAIPHAVAAHASERLIAMLVAPLHAIHLLMLPAARLMRSIDRLVGRAAGTDGRNQPDQIEQEIEAEILSAVEEGEKEGVVDEEEREMIESVIEFRDTQVGQTMTARPEIVALDLHSSLEKIKRTIVETGHSRIPIFDGTLDHVVGILYARDLLRFVGEPPEQFDIRSAMRPAFYVPKSKALRDLLRDFRLQKIHIAIVLDEYGGTAGLVTIEDVLEELVGEISDEHEPQEPAMLKRLDEQSFEVDARIYIDEFNRLVGLNLPEDAGYDTLGGFISTTLGRIPAVGTVFEHAGVRYTVLDAEPQKVNRLRVELTPQPAESGGEPR